MRQAVGRTWDRLAEETVSRIPARRSRWVSGSRLRSGKDERREIERIFATEDVRLLVTALRSRENDASVEVLDAAYWMKGCSSLGRLRFAVLLGVGKSHAKEGGLCLIDIKEAVQAAAPHHAKAAMPPDQGMRVVEGARHLSPALGDRMLGATFLDRAIFMRELLPEDLKLEIDRISREEAMKAARYRRCW